MPPLQRIPANIPQKLTFFVVSRTVSEIRRLIGRKSPIRTHPTLIQRPRSGWPPSNFGMNLISSETRMMGLPYGEEIMIVGRTVWTQSTSVTDRQTKGQTELLSQRPCNTERRTVKTKRVNIKDKIYLSQTLSLNAVVNVGVLFTQY